MKCHEIITEREIKSQPSDDSVFKSQRKMATQHTELGSGVFGKAYDITDADVGHVVKIASLDQGDPQLDGYYQWVKRVYLLGGGNPYLPQFISEPIVYNWPGGAYIKVELEKLIPANALTDEEYEIVLERIIDRPLTSDEIQIIFKGRLTPYNLMAGILSSYARGNPIPYTSDLDNIKIKDPDLIQALKIVNHIHRQGFLVDLHHGNFMFRRTGYGPQLVITDPLGFAKANAVERALRHRLEAEAETEKSDPIGRSYTI